MQIESRKYWAALAAMLSVALLCLLMVETNRSVSVLAGSVNSKDRGAALFHDKGCDHCHGPAGIGGGKGPDLSNVKKKLKKDQITNQIMNGGGNMPAFGELLETQEVDDLVAFLESKRTAPTPKP